MTRHKNKDIQYQACETGAPLLSSPPPPTPTQDNNNNDDDDNHHHHSSNSAHQEPAMTTITINDPKTCRICGDDDQESDSSNIPGETSTTSDDHAAYKRHQVMNSKCRGAAHTTTAEDDNPLIRPCKCKGSMMYVHVNCLNRWRVMSPRKKSYLSCDLCGYRYNLHRPRYAAIVSHRYFIRTITFIIVLLLTVGLAYACKAVDVYALGHVPQPENDEWRQWHGPTILWMDRIYLAAGVIGISFLGFLYVLIVCITSASATATDDYTSFNARADDDMPFMCCGQASCWYGCDFYIADSHCHGDAALGGIIVFAIFMFITMILFGIMGAVGGVYTLTESIVKRIAGRVKERILEVDL